MKTYRETKRTYYKYTSWTQPTLTSNGTMGASNFACYANRTYNGNPTDAYQAFSPNTGYVGSYISLQYSTLYVYFQTKNYLLITNFSFYIPIVNSNNNYDGGHANNLKLEGFSIKNRKWETLATIVGGTNMGNKTHTMNLSSNTKYYKLFRLQGTTSGNGHKDEIDFSQIKITGKQATTGTSSDYDFYEDEYVYKAPKNEVTRYYKYDKPNVTIVGSSVINSSNVASGFSTSSWLKAFNFKPAKESWEIQVKVKTGSDYTHFNDICGMYAGPFTSLAIGIATNKKFRISIGDGSTTDKWTNSLTSTATFKDNTVYWFRVKFTGSVYSIEYSTDGKTFTQDKTLTASYSLPAGDFLLGQYSANSTNFFTGSIYLTDCYVKLNNELIWTGMMYYPSSSSSYDFTRKENAYSVSNT